MVGRVVRQEQWWPVEGHEGYEVSNLGQVRSLDRWRTDSRGRSYMRHGQMLRQWQERRQRSQPYMLVNLGRGRAHQVHELVARAFLGLRPPGQQIRHGLRGQLCNWDTNLSYGTAAENRADMQRDGTLPRGEKIPWAKLTNEQVQECQARYAAGEKQVTLAAEFGVDRRVIWRAIHTRMEIG